MKIRCESSELFVHRHIKITRNELTCASSESAVCTIACGLCGRFAGGAEHGAHNRIVPPASFVCFVCAVRVVVLYGTRTKRD